MKTTTELTQTKLVKKFHTLLSKYRIGNEDKMSILGSFGVESSLDLTIDQLAQVCDAVEKTFATTTGSATMAADKLDVMRKRLIASIFAWRASLGTPTTDMNLVKAIACRAAEIPDGYALSIRFNSIPEAKLQSLYNAFRHMKKDMSKVKEMTQEMVDKLTTLN
jgi:hypothetical protein